MSWYLFIKNREKIASVFVSRRKLDIKPVDNHLAIISWVPSQFQRSTVQLSLNKKSCDESIENEEPVAMQDEYMVLMEDNPVQLE